MARCGVCANDYLKSFSIRTNGGEYVFDSFECAIHALAPSVRIAAAESSVMASRLDSRCFAAPTAHVRRAFRE